MGLLAEAIAGTNSEARANGPTYVKIDLEVEGRRSEGGA